MINVIRLHNYVQFLRHQYLDTFETLSWKEFVKDRSASFDSLRNIYLHSIECVDFITRLIQSDNPLSIRHAPIPYDEYTTIETIQKYLEQVESRFNSLLSQLTPSDMRRKVTRMHGNESSSTSTVEDHLIHLFQEEIHHFGEFIALLWQMNVKPPHIGWVNYLTLIRQN
jgi:uncharacterized damage-inducible protein DinB